MPKELVRDVQGSWKTDGMGKRYIDLRWISADGEAHFTGFFEESIAAISTWLKRQPLTPPTPDEIAADIVDEWHSVPIERNALRRRIAEAIKTERERHDV